MSSQQEKQRGTLGGLPRFALNPGEPLLSQPAKSLVDRGIIASLSATFTPTGVQVVGRRGPLLVKDGRLPDVDVGFGTLLEEAKAANLMFGVGGKPQKSKKETTGKPAEPLPTRSLCDKDFEGFGEASFAARFQARCNNVASRLGGEALSGRLMSSLDLRPEVDMTFQQWWQKATAANRLQALSEKRRVTKVDAGKTMALNGVQCPFLGTLELVGRKEKASSPEKGEEVAPDGGEPVPPPTGNPVEGGSVVPPPPNVPAGAKGGDGAPEPKKPAEIVRPPGSYEYIRKGEVKRFVGLGWRILGNYKPRPKGGKGEWMFLPAA